MGKKDKSDDSSESSSDEKEPELGLIEMEMESSACGCPFCGPGIQPHFKGSIDFLSISLKIPK